MYNAKAYSAASATSPLAPTTIPRRDPTAHDVQIDILFCGICHSDLHHVRNEFGSLMPTIYPIVPGHEIIGRVTKSTCSAWMVISPLSARRRSLSPSPPSVCCSDAAASPARSSAASPKPRKCLISVASMASLPMSK